MLRTKRCGQVIGPSEMTASARSRSAGPSPSAPQPADGEKIEADCRAPMRGLEGGLGPGLAIRQCRAPHLFEIVIASDVRPEDVHDDIAGVDQHPIALALALDRDPAGEDLLQM